MLWSNKNTLPYFSYLYSGSLTSHICIPVPLLLIFVFRFPYLYLYSCSLTSHICIMVPLLIFVLRFPYLYLYSGSLTYICIPVPLLLIFVFWFPAAVLWQCGVQWLVLDRLGEEGEPQKPDNGCSEILLPGCRGQVQVLWPPGDAWQRYPGCPHHGQSEIWQWYTVTTVLHNIIFHFFYHILVQNGCNSTFCKYIIFYLPYNVFLHLHIKHMAFKLILLKL